MKTMDKRLTRVEMALENFIDNVGNSLDRLSMEMHEFKDEMRINANRRDREMKEFKNEMRADAQLRDKEMREFKEEMKDFKDEMREFKDEMSLSTKQRDKEIKEFKKDINKKWGDLSRKMGTIVEDIIYPGINTLIKKFFKEEPTSTAIRVKRKKGALRDEFDVIAVLKKYVIMVEVKSKPNHNNVLDMEDKVVSFRKLFQEYSDKEVIPVLGSLVIGNDVVNLCTKCGVYALAYREWDYLDILNFDRLFLTHKKRKNN